MQPRGLIIINRPASLLYDWWLFQDDVQSTWDVRCFKGLTVKWRTRSLPELTKLTPPRMVTQACAHQLLHADTLYYRSPLPQHPHSSRKPRPHPKKTLCCASRSSAPCRRRLGGCRGVLLCLPGSGQIRSGCGGVVFFSRFVILFTHAVCEETMLMSVQTCAGVLVCVTSLPRSPLFGLSTESTWKW